VTQIISDQRNRRLLLGSLATAAICVTTACYYAEKSGGEAGTNSATAQADHHGQIKAAAAAAAPAAAAVVKNASRPTVPSNVVPLPAAEPGAVVDALNKKIMPGAVVLADDQLLFLTPAAIWVAANASKQLQAAGPIKAEQFAPPKSFGGVPVQELCNLIYAEKRNSVVVLDKSGDLYEFLLDTHKWRLFRSNMPFLAGQPDPEFIDLAVLNDKILLLDPERNQIWKPTGSARTMNGFFPDVFPWRAKRGDASLGDAAAIACDGNVYVIKRYGPITIYGDGLGKSAPQTVFKFARPNGLRPSRLITAAGTPLFIVERENNRVLSIDKKTHKVSSFQFPASGDLRGLVPLSDGFWLLDNGILRYRALSKADKGKSAVATRHPDSRLDGMIMPIAGMRLPRHPGVFPGARRLYRYGVHEGLDLFYDAGAKTKVQMGTPARAADSGKVIRADANFKDMNAVKFNKVMTECAREHRTSAANEDLLRGCQVWIDHGNHLVTRYAHLDRINPVVKTGGAANTGELIGFVGVSGTGQNLPGRARYPHLHFEIWLDGHYLGWGLTPTETMQVYEDIFGN
jgi:murein DD-endopeptidase MepM/ murein hydrolase activator NlpD